MASTKDHIGDGVYADIENGMLKLTTEDGIGGPTNTIYLEPEVYVALTRYVARVLAEADAAKLAGPARRWDSGR